MSAPLEGKRVVLTGAASGIGLASVQAATEAGARVVGVDIDAPASLGHHSPNEDRKSIIRANLADPAEVRRAIDAAAQALGGIDVLVNCAGIMIGGTLADMDVDDLDRMYAINLRAPILAAQAALAHMQAGVIINVASELAYLGRAGASGYCATKGAMLSLTRSWARELAPHVRVNAVAPGPIDTPLLGFAALDPEQQALELSNPLGRIGTAGEVAAAIVFLAGDQAGFITGQCLSVDGGAAMH